MNKQNNILSLTESTREAFELYKRWFVCGSYGIHKGYGYQPIFGKWKTVKRSITDQDVLDHLEQKNYISLLPPYYPAFAIVDIDFHDQGENNFQFVDERVQYIIEVLRLKDSQYLLFTSPSYLENGSQHLIFPVEYHGKPATKKLIQIVLNPLVSSLSCELFPCGNRKMRAPLGFRQFLLCKETGMKLHYTWEENMMWLEKLSPKELSDYSKQTSFAQNVNYTNEAVTPDDKNDIRYIFKNGLQSSGTRHRILGELTQYFFSKKYSKESAREKLKNWIHKKHNGFSSEANNGNWRLIDNEIDSWVEWVYSRFKQYIPSNTYEESWKYQGISKKELGLIIKTFHGDLNNQQRLFRLFQLFRSKTNKPNEWIRIHSDLAIKVFGNKYKAFFEKIEDSILKINHVYCASKFSKQYQLIPKIYKNSKLITNTDGEILTDWLVVLTNFFGNIQTASEKSGIHKQRFYEHEKSKTNSTENSTTNSTIRISA